MRHWTSYALRAGFIVGFLIVLPVMAMPKVAALLDRLLYGEPQSNLPPPSETGKSLIPRRSEAADDAPVTHELPLQTESPISSKLPVDLNPASPFQAGPPALPSSPDFVRQAGNSEPEPNPAQSGPDVGPLDQATAAKIAVVRGRLEELGAEYVRLEMSADGREFHCLCHMLVSNDPSQIQPFEATRKDPVAAAQAVLSNVQAWRIAERAPLGAPKRGPPARPR